MRITKYTNTCLIICKTLGTENKINVQAFKVKRNQNQDRKDPSNFIPRQKIFFFFSIHVFFFFYVDISAGFSPSIFDIMRDTTGVSNLLSDGTAQKESVSYKEAFRLATLGGSKGKKTMNGTQDDRGISSLA